IKNHTDLYELVSPESIDQIEKWVSKTNNGLLLEINGNYDRKIIDEIKSNSTLCLSNKCKFFNECFYYSARRRLNNADIIVTNHHLFLSYELIDYFSDFFPVYNTLIFDEGHNLPDVIENISTFTFSTFEIQKKLYKLVQSQQKNKGLFYLLENSLSKNNLNDKTIGKKILSLLPDLINQVLELEGSISNIHNRTIYQIINIAFSNNLSNNKSKILINLTNLAKTNPDVLKEIYELLDETFNQIQFLVDNSAFLIQALQIILEDKVKKDEELSSLQYLYGNIKSIIKFFDDIKDFHEELSDLFNNRSKSQNLLKVLWFEISNNGIYFSFYNEERGLNFNNIIESKVNSTIFISATLATENSFDYIKSQLGLSENIKKNTEDKIYPSIFPYEKNSSLFIIKGINPLIKKDYAKNISDIILKVLSSTKAKTMILTTAYNDINEISEAIKDNHKDIKLLIQESLLLNNSLIDEFKKTDRAVLVVNMSFWEGIDLPGKDLEILIISKLPFKVPDTPILKAKTERMDNQGINSFYSLSLPYAIIKLKQGFGRLIRSEEEKGICILLDDRIISKNYGPIILNSLPKSKLEIVEKDQFLIKFKEKCEELEISN
ncbi:MAG: ATP-dependent DNA helicase, partial [Spirochaetota bacterium]